jgi:UDP-N-acetylmuramoyl-tripeptide--D-alanyl-D-alanine ligase
VNLSLDYICEAVGGRIISGKPGGAVSGVCTDSRKMGKGNIFIALIGEVYDAHDFVDQAFENGAVAAIVSEPEKAYHPDEDQVLILVEDTLRALQDLAASYRNSIAIPVIAVTGSVGKTTTKDIIASCLRSRFKVLKTEGNFNNDIGLPLSLLQLEREHDVAVVELGMSSPGEIARLASISNPAYAIITNVEPVHLENMLTLENIARAKCEVLPVLGEKGVALINGDDELLLKTARDFTGRLLTFGYNAICDLRILETSLNTGSLKLKLKILDQYEGDFYFPVPAAKLAGNIAASAGLAYLMGLTPQEIQDGLSAYQPSGNRLKMIYRDKGGLFINDTYNANPVSMAAAIETARALANSRRLIAVLGDMFELGSYEEEGHFSVGRAVARNEVDILVTIGKRAVLIAKGAREAGMDAKRIYSFPSRDDSLAFLKETLQEEDTVLFKASRGMNLELLVDKLL